MRDLKGYDFRCWDKNLEGRNWEKRDLKGISSLNFVYD